MLKNELNDLEVLEELIQLTLTESKDDLSGELDSLIGDIEYTLKQKMKTAPGDWKRASAELLRLTEKYL